MIRIYESLGIARLVFALIICTIILGLVLDFLSPDWGSVHTFFVIGIPLFVIWAVVIIVDLIRTFLVDNIPMYDKKVIGSYIFFMFLIWCIAILLVVL